MHIIGLKFRRTFGCLVLSVCKLACNNTTMRGSDIKFGCMNVHSLQICKFSRLVRILKKSKTPAKVISLQETWHGHNSRVIHDIESCGYRVIHKPRSNTQPQRYQRGGVATVCLDTRLKFSPITLRTKPSTMEYVVTIVQLRSHICRVLNVYRPGSRKATKIFFSKLEKLIKRYSMRKKM